MATMDTTEAPQIIEHLNKSLNFTPYDTRWVPCSARMVCLGITPKGKGALQVYEMSRGELSLVSESFKPQGIKCGTFGASSIEQRHMACGDFKGNLSIYDLSRQDAPVFSAQAHKSIINTIDGIGGQTVGYGAPELVTGGRDGCVRVWDPRVPEKHRSLMPSPAG